MRILTSSHGTDRTAEVIHVGVSCHGVEVGESKSVFLESDCLELLLMQAAQNNGLTDGMKREMLQEVTYM